MKAEVFHGRMKGLDEILVDDFRCMDRQHTALFISHSHTDHLKGLGSYYENKCNYICDILSKSLSKLYCTKETACLIRKRSAYVNYLHLEFFELIEVGATFEIKTVSGSPISVQVLPASHCTGSVMFLFTRNGTRTLYTGDFRLGLSDTLNPSITVLPIDNLYVDTSFLSDEDWCRDFPTHEESVAVVKEIINSRPDETFHLEFSEGKEPVLEGLHAEVPICAGSEIEYKFRDTPSVRQYFSSDETRVHAGIFFPTGCTIECPSCTEETLFIRVSCLWRRFVSDGTLPFHEFQPGKFKVAFSNHCSFNEVKRFIQLVGARNVFPIAILDDMPVSELEKNLKEITTGSAPDTKEKGKEVHPDERAGAAVEGVAKSETLVIKMGPAKATTVPSESKAATHLNRDEVIEPERKKFKLDTDCC